MALSTNRTRALVISLLSVVGLVLVLGLPERLLTAYAAYRSTRHPCLR